MLNHDAADDPRAAFFDDPVEEIEPENSVNEYREASLKMIGFMFSAVNYIHEAKSQSELRIRLWAVSCAIDHPAVSGRSHTEIASLLGTTRANLSKHILNFEKQTGLPPTLSQKSVDARQKYSIARIMQLRDTQLPE